MSQGIRHVEIFHLGSQVPQPTEGPVSATAGGPQRKPKSRRRKDIGNGFPGKLWHENMGKTCKLLENDGDDEACGRPMEVRFGRDRLNSQCFKAKTKFQISSPLFRFFFPHKQEQKGGYVSPHYNIHTIPPYSIHFPGASSASMPCNWVPWVPGITGLMPFGPGNVPAGHAQVEPLQLGHDILPWLRGKPPSSDRN